MDKTTLIKRCQLGDLESFEELYKLYSKNAMGTAYLIAKHKSAAEDIVQEAFFQCYKQIKNLRDPEAFDVWFYKLLVRLAWKQSSECRNTSSIEEIGNGIALVSERFGLEFDQEENKLLVRAAIDKLSPPLKTVIILYYFNDMTIKQISMVLGCFQGTVKSRLHNAKKCLEKDLCDSIREGSSETMYVAKEYKTNG